VKKLALPEPTEESIKSDVDFLFDRLRGEIQVFLSWNQKPRILRSLRELLQRVEASQ
jgi:hypothetical protein